MSDLQNIKKALFYLSQYLQSELTDEQIVMYATELEKDGLQFVVAACNCVKNSTENYYGKFPTPAQLRVLVNGSDDDYALETSLKIIRSVSKFGHMQAKEARDFIGQLGWDVVNSYGGWANVCSTLEADKVSIAQSQYTKTAKMLIGAARRPERDGASLASPETRKMLNGTESTAHSVGAIIGRLYQQNQAPEGRAGQATEGGGLQKTRLVGRGEEGLGDH